MLASVESQLEPGVEIVISDDASTDDTAEVVGDFQARLGCLTYERHDPALLYDRNVLRVVDRASGKFCWLFGDDDRLEPGGLAAVLQFLREHPAVTGLTTDRISYDPALARAIPVRPLRWNDTTLFAEAEKAWLELLDRLGFLSCQVIRRERWQEVAASEDLRPYYAGYVQLYMIARLLVKYAQWGFLAEKCVGFRSDNDSFRTLGSLGRLRMDVHGYEQITGDVFGRRSRVYRRTMAEVAVTHARHHIVSARRAGAPFTFSLGAMRICLPVYWRYARFWTGTFPLLLMPRRLLLFLRGLHQRRTAQR